MRNMLDRLLIALVVQERFGGSRFWGFLKRKIRDWMAPMERFIFWAIIRGFIPEVTRLRSISSSVSVHGRPAGRPVICPSPSALHRLVEGMQGRYPRPKSLDLTKGVVTVLS